jgi:hypothetical protein
VLVLVFRKAFPGLRKPPILIALALSLGIGQAVARKKTVREGIASAGLAMAMYDAGQTFVGEPLRKSEFGAKMIPLPCLQK